MSKDNKGRKRSPLQRLKDYEAPPEYPEFRTEPSPPETRAVWAKIREHLPSAHFTAGTTHKDVKALTLQAVAEVAQALGYGRAKFNGAFRIYTGTHWVALDGAAFTRELVECTEAMGFPRADARGTTMPQGLRNVAEIDLTDVGRADATDAAPSARVNLANGTLHIDAESNPELREHSPADRLTYCLPYAHDPGAECPQFDAFLAEVQPDPEVRRLLAEAFGAAFVNVKLEKVAFLYGGGANGKSVLTDVLGAAFGRENVGSRSLEDLVNKETHRLELADKLLNICPETGDGKLDAPAFNY